MPDQDQVSRIAREVFLGTLFPAAHSESMAWGRAQTAKRMQDVYLRAGDVLYRQGDTAEDYFFVVSGEMRLVAEGLPTWTFGPRSVVGTLDVIIERPRSRTAMANKDAMLLRLRGEDWLDVLEDNFELTRVVVGNIVRTIRGLRAKLAPSGGFDEPTMDGRGAFPNRPLNVIERILVLRDVAPMARAGIQTLVSLAEHAEEIRTTPGEILFDRGGGGEHIWVVAHGEVELTSEDPAMHARFGAATVVGDVPPLYDGASYVARSATNGVVLRFHLEDFFDVMEEHFDLARSLLMCLGLTNERLLNNLPNGGEAETAT
jgi:CRP-like cAMP-binding protein